jgi:hypothetical protein
VLRQEYLCEHPNGYGYTGSVSYPWGGKRGLGKPLLRHYFLSSSDFPRVTGLPVEACIRRSDSAADEAGSKDIVRCPTSTVELEAWTKRPALSGFSRGVASDKVSPLTIVSLAACVKGGLAVVGGARIVGKYE